MRLYFERSGGFGGMRLTAELDTDQLQATYGAALFRERCPQRRLVTSKGWSSPLTSALPARTSAAMRGADRFQYVLTVENTGKRHSVQTMDEAAPEALGALLADKDSPQWEGRSCRIPVTRLDSDRF